MPFRYGMTNETGTDQGAYQPARFCASSSRFRPGRFLFCGAGHFFLKCAVRIADYASNSGSDPM